MPARRRPGPSSGREDTVVTDDDCNEACYNAVRRAIAARVRDHFRARNGRDVLVRLQGPFIRVRRRAYTDLQGGSLYIRFDNGRLDITFYQIDRVRIDLRSPQSLDRLDAILGRADLFE
jgi:hypothetical protein